MTHDRLQIPMLQLSPFLDTAHPDDLIAIDASRLHGVFQNTYGEGIPTDVRAKWATGKVLATMTEYSTSDTLAIEDVTRFLPSWLQLMGPFIDSNTVLGKIVDAQLKTREEAVKGEPVSRNDLLYCASLFDVASLAIAGELCIYPQGRGNRVHAESLAARGIPVKSDEQKASEKQALTFLLSSNLFNAAHRRKLAKFQTVAEKMVHTSNRNLVRLREIVPEMAFEDLDVIEDD